MTFKVIIADDHGILRAGMVALLSGEATMQVIGEADTCEKAIAIALEKQPDLVLMDISMPEMGGIQATRQIVEALPQVRVLIMTVHEDRGLMEDAINAGATGYILKSAIKSDLFNAIDTVLRGELYVQPAMARLLFQKPGNKATASPLTLSDEPLTQREVDVLRLIAQGYTNKQAAELLSLSVRTVEYHRGNITGKLNLHSRVELARYAEELGIL